MTKCAFCGKEIEGLPFRCRYCGQYFCAEHHLPENHNCPLLPEIRRPHTPWFPRKYEERRTTWSRIPSRSEIPVTRRTRRYTRPMRLPRLRIEDGGTGKYIALFLFLLSIFMPWIALGSRWGGLGANLIEIAMQAGSFAWINRWIAYLIYLVLILAITTVILTFFRPGAGILTGSMTVLVWLITLSMLRGMLGFFAALIGPLEGLGFYLWIVGIIVLLLSR